MNGSDFEDIRDLVRRIANPADERVRKLYSTSREEDMQSAKFPTRPHTQNIKDHKHHNSLMDMDLLGLIDDTAQEASGCAGTQAKAALVAEYLQKATHLHEMATRFEKKTLDLLPKPGPGYFEISFQKSTKHAPVCSALHGEREMGAFREFHLDLGLQACEGMLQFSAECFCKTPLGPGSYPQDTKCAVDKVALNREALTMKLMFWTIFHMNVSWQKC